MWNIKCKIYNYFYCLTYLFLNSIKQVENKQKAMQIKLTINYEKWQKGEAVLALLNKLCDLLYVHYSFNKVTLE